MAYTPPSGLAVVLALEPNYTPQSGDEVVLDFEDGRIWTTLFARAGALATAGRALGAVAGGYLQRTGTVALTAAALVLGAQVQVATAAGAVLTRAGTAVTVGCGALLVRGVAASIGAEALLTQWRSVATVTDTRLGRRRAVTVGAAPCLGALHPQTVVASALLRRAANVQGLGASVLLRGGVTRYARAGGLVQRVGKAIQVTASVSLADATVSYGARADMTAPAVDAIFAFADGLVLIRPVLELDGGAEWALMPRASEWEPAERPREWEPGARAHEFLVPARNTEWAPTGRTTDVD